MAKYKVRWMGMVQWADLAAKQEQGRTGGIWLMVRSRRGGPLNRIWFSKSEVSKVDNTPVEV